ncbi:MAG TPA: glycosyltransferase family 4 protein [Allosphingosinicella sp.]|nr:glycosyltransferase family 4 protein [Allosphingosinicella sp.]
MKQKTVLISINAAWNIVNFRSGLIAALRVAGYRVMALAPSDAWRGRLEALGVEYAPLEMDKKGVSPVADLRLLARYWRALGRMRPDVFLGYTPKPNIWGSIAAHARGIKVINNVSGLGTAFIRPGALMRIVTDLYKRAFRRSKTIFFQNEEDMALFLDRKIVRRDQARLLPGSGIDLERFQPADQTGGEEGFAFLLIARLLWDKGVGEYVEAARLVRAEAPEVRFRLVGFLDVANRTAVPRSEVEAWVAEGLIDYLGESDDVRPHVGAAGCIVLPSYREGLPRTLLEGAAMAKPLIATDVPGCRQVVNNGVNGLLCEVRDARSLADAMLVMLRMTPAEREAMGAAGRRKVEAEYDERIAIARYLEAIRDALG